MRVIIIQQGGLEDTASIQRAYDIELDMLGKRRDRRRISQRIQMPGLIGQVLAVRRKPAGIPLEHIPPWFGDHEAALLERIE